VRGEGEQTLLKIAEAVDEGKSVEDIGGVVFKENGEIICNPLIKPSGGDNFYNFAMASVRHCVIERGELMPADILLQNISIPHADAASYHTMIGIGCIHDCTYCCAGKMSKLYDKCEKIPKRRIRNIDDVIEELKFARDYGFKYISFLDSFFVAPKKYLMNFFKLYRDEVCLPFFAQPYPNQIIKNPDLLDAAVNSGMDYMVIGIQSGSDRINNKVFNRPLPNRQVLKLANMVSKYESVKIQYHIITHNPFQRAADFNESIELVGALPKNNAELVLLKLNPFPGTEIANMIKLSAKELLNEDVQQMNRDALLLMLRFIMSDDDNLKKPFNSLEKCDFKALRNVISEQIVGSTLKKQTGMASIPIEGFDLTLYYGKIKNYGIHYEKALNEWIDRRDEFSRRKVDKIYEECIWDHLNSHIEEMKVDLSGLFYGTGWGISESNVHGQRWRWIGPSKASILFLKLKSGSGYELRTGIHTAVGENLFKLRIKANNEEIDEQHIQNKDGVIFHKCKIPGELIDKVGGRVVISYIIEEKDSMAKKSLDILPGIHMNQLVAVNNVLIKEVV
jgi:radical SAM superfamily enzyme YgiQ (UPF0313 family)